MPCHVMSYHFIVESCHVMSCHVIPGDALHEAGLQGQKGAGPLVSSQERRAGFVHHAADGDLRPNLRLRRSKLGERFFDLRGRRTKMGEGFSVFGAEDRRLKMGGSTIFGAEDRRPKNHPHLQSSFFDPEDRRTPSVYDLRPRRMGPRSGGR